ncbi:MAG: tetratricopeptide repeat protein [Acidobacteriota bacterium]
MSSDPSSNEPATPLAFLGDRPAETKPPPADKRRIWPYLVAVAAIVVLGAAFAAVYFADDLLDRAPPMVLANGSRLAVLPFVDATGERGNEWLALGLSEWVAHAIEETPRTAIVPSDLLVDAILERGLADRAAMRELAFAMGADVAIDITVSRDDDLWRADVQAYTPEGQAASSEVARDDPMATGESLVRLLVNAASPDVLPPDIEVMYSGNRFLDRLWAMGNAALRAGDAATAEPYFDICLRHQPRFLLAQARLADTVRMLGDYDRAREIELELLELAQGRNDNYLLGRSAYALGLITALEGKWDQADRNFHQAEAIFASRKDTYSQLRILEKRVRFAQARRRPDLAAQALDDLLGLQHQIPHRLGQAETLVERANLALDLDDIDAADTLLTQADDVAQEIGDPRTLTRVASGIGEVAWRRGDFATAGERWQSAAAYHRQHGETRRVASLLTKLGAVAEASGDLETAEAHYVDAIDLAEDLDDQALAGRLAMRAAQVLIERGYPYQARPHLRYALDRDQAIGDPLGLQRLIARFAYEQGHFRTAFETLGAMSKSEVWTEQDAIYLAVYEQATKVDRRIPLPGEPEVPGGRPITP